MGSHFNSSSAIDPELLAHEAGHVPVNMTMASVHAVDEAPATEPLPTDSGATALNPSTASHYAFVNYTMQGRGLVPTGGAGVQQSKRQRMGRSRYGRFANAGNLEAVSSTPDQALQELAPQTLQEMDVNEKREFVLIADELRRTLYNFPTVREQAVLQYVDKAKFYITRVRKHRHLRPLIFSIPFGNTTLPITFDDACSTVASRPLTELILRYLRGLDFIGQTTLSGPHSFKKRIDFFFHSLGYCSRCIERGAYPGEAEFFALMRLKINRKFREYGRELIKRDLVRIVEVHGKKVYEWSPACDAFNDPAWSFSGKWPDPGAPSAFPNAAPPGWLLDQVSSIHAEDG